MKNWDFCRRSFDHSLEVFRSKYLIKGTFHLKKNTKFFFCTQKMKNWVLFGEVFLKVWKFSAQSRETKKHFLWEKIPNCSSAHVFSGFDRTTATFLPNLWQKKPCSKNTLPHLECTFKNTVENCSAEAQTFKFKSKKNLILG